MGERKDGEERKRRATGGKEWEKGGEKGKRRHNKQREEEKVRGDIKWTDKKKENYGWRWEEREESEMVAMRADETITVTSC